MRMGISVDRGQFQATPDDRDVVANYRSPSRCATTSAVHASAGITSRSNSSTPDRS